MAATVQSVLGQNSGAVVGRERLSRLFQDLAGGQAEALGGIYDLCAEDLFGLALWRIGSHADAADVVQDVFVRLAERRERLRGVRNPRSYLLAMAHRAAVDVHRRRGRRPHQALESCPYLTAPPDDPARGVDADRISTMLPELPETQREAVYLRHFAGLTFAEIGQVTGVPAFTAASRNRLGIRRLRQMMGVEP